MQWQKSKLPKKLPNFDPAKTAEQNMADAGFLRQNDLGTRVYMWIKS